jgi:hypothetical protein
MGENSKSIKDGGPAFPSVIKTIIGYKQGFDIDEKLRPCNFHDDLPEPIFGEPTHIPGMSVRDYFATKAMQGIISNMNFDKKDDKFVAIYKDTEIQFSGIALSAYQMTDEILKAREE